MSAYESREELARKAEWEGGLYDFIFEYGLQRDDLPYDPELLEAFDELMKVWEPFEAALNKFEALLPELDF